MKTLITSIALLAALAASNLCSADPVNVGHLVKQNWTMLESEHFNVTTNAKNKDAKHIIREMEDFWYFVEQILGYEQKPLDKKIPVVISKTRYTLRALGINRSLGVFSSSPRGHVIVLSAKDFKSSDKEESLGRHVIYHELVHAMMRNAGKTYPYWYSEGLSEYLATYRKMKGKIYLGDLSLLMFRYRNPTIQFGIEYMGIKSKRIFHAERYFSDAKSHLASAHLSKWELYGGALAIVHYMNSNREKQIQLQKFIYLLDKGFSIDDSFTTLFKMDYKEFDKIVDTYMNGLHVKARAFPIGKGGVQFPKVKYKLSKLHTKSLGVNLFEKLLITNDATISEEEKSDMMKEYESKLNDA